MRVSVAISMLLISGLAQASDTLIFAMSDALEMPFINHNKANDLPGILVEWNTALAKQLGKKAAFAWYSSKRVVLAMEDRTANSLCYVLPQWLPSELANNLVWSPPFLSDQESIVLRNDQKEVTQLSDLYGQRLGTVLGYQYMSLQSDLDAKRIIRDDAPTEALLFKKLFAGRHHHAVVHDMTTTWYRKTEPRMESYLSSNYVVTSYRAKCAFNPNTGLNEQDLKSAFAELDKRRVMAAILQKYQ